MWRVVCEWEREREGAKKVRTNEIENVPAFHWNAGAGCPSKWTFFFAVLSLVVLLLDALSGIWFVKCRCYILSVCMSVISQWILSIFSCVSHFPISQPECFHCLLCAGSQLASCTVSKINFCVFDTCKTRQQQRETRSQTNCKSPVDFALHHLTWIAISIGNVIDMMYTECVSMVPRHHTRAVCYWGIATVMRLFYFFYFLLLDTKEMLVICRLYSHFHWWYLHKSNKLGLSI